MYAFNQLLCVPLIDGTMTQSKLAKWKNKVEYFNDFSLLFNEALERYRVEGLPTTCSERVVLQSFLLYGCCIFFEIEDNVLALPGVPTGDFNMYGDPLYGWVYGMNGFNKRITLFMPGSDDAAALRKGNNFKANGEPFGVLVRENPIMYPFINVVLKYADAISDTFRTLDVCRANIKQPFIVTAQEEIVNSVKKFFKERNNNVDFVVSSGVFPSDKISLLPFETNESNLKNTTDLIEWYYNRFHEECAKFSNSNPDKKERLLVDEVNANNDITESKGALWEQTIQEGLDYANELFGLNMRIVRKEAEADELQPDDNVEPEPLSGNSD